MTDEITIQKFLPKAVEDEEVNLEVVTTKGGKELSRYRGAKSGMFSKASPGPSKKEIQERTTELLTNSDNSPDGKSPWQRAVENVSANAGLSCEQPCFDKLHNVILDAEGNPLMVKDPKMVMSVAKSLDSISRIMDIPSKDESRTLGVVKVELGLSSLAAALLARDGGVPQEFTGWSAPPVPSFIEGEVISEGPGLPKIPVARTQPTKTERVYVESLYARNAVKFAKEASLTVSVIRDKAGSDLPLRLTAAGEVVAGWFRLASAYSYSTEQIDALIEQE